MLDGIRQKVQEDLARALGIGPYSEVRRRVRQMCDQMCDADIVAIRIWTDESTRRSDQLADGHRFGANLKASGLVARQVHEVLHECEHVPRSGQDVAAGFFHCRTRRALA